MKLQLIKSIFSKLLIISLNIFLLTIQEVLMSKKRYIFLSVVGISRIEYNTFFSDNFPLKAELVSYSEYVKLVIN